MTRKVRVNACYRYDPVLFDSIMSPPAGDVQPGDIVRVVNLYGCPPANTMGMCYIENPNTGEFLGMVCTNSLQPK